MYDDLEGWWVLVTGATQDSARPRYRLSRAVEFKPIARGIPMGRLGRPRETAPDFLFFASRAASGCITGQVLDINGGPFMP